MTDILALSNWAVLSVEHGKELTIKAEYLVQPDCCLKCGSKHFYKHGPKLVAYRADPKWNANDKYGNSRIRAI